MQTKTKITKPSNSGIHLKSEKPPPESTSNSKTKKKQSDRAKETIYPNELIIIPNKEKKFHEKWFDGRNMLNFPHPYRMLLCSIQPSLGKTLWVFNVLLRAQPKFKEIFLLHCGEDVQTEYDDIDYTTLTSLPEINSDTFDHQKKSLLIIEDKNFKYMGKDDLHRLDRAYGYTSTHRNLSIICCSQSFFDVPPSVRRMSNIYVLWKTKDIDSMKTIGRRCGLTKEELYRLIRTYLNEIHDTLWIDCTKATPYPLRLNGFDNIDKKEHEID